MANVRREYSDAEKKALEKLSNKKSYNDSEQSAVDKLKEKTQLSSDALRDLANQVSEQRSKIGAIQSAYATGDNYLSGNSINQLSRTIYNYQSNLGKLRMNGADTSAYDKDANALLQKNGDLASYYGKFTADNYQNESNALKESQKNYKDRMSYDTDAGQKEIDNLTAIRDRMKKDNATNSVAEYYDELIRQGVDPFEASDLAKKKKADRESEINSYLDGTGYSTYDELNNAISSKTQYLYSAKNLQNSEKYVNDAKNDSNYNTFINVGKATAGEKTGLFNNSYTNLVGSMREDPTLLESYERASKAGATKVSHDIQYKAAKYMTDDEYNTYSYYIGKGDLDTANNYLNSLEDTLNYREAQGVYGELEGNALKEILYGYSAGVDQFATGIVNLINTDDYIPTSSTQYASNMAREDLSDVGVNVLGSSLGQIAFDTVRTTSNMLPTIAASYITSGLLGTLGVGAVTASKAGSIVGTSLMGASASGNEYASLLNSGMNKSQARAISLVKGAWEGASEYYLGAIEGLAGGKISGAIENTKLLNNLKLAGNGLSYALLKYFSDNAVEGMEEVVQDIGESIIDGVMQGKWEFSNIEEQAYNFALGALSAGVMGVPGAVSNTANVNNIYRASQADLVAEGLASEEGTFARTAAEKYQAKLDKGKNLNAIELQNLVEANDKAIEAENIAKENAESLGTLQENLTTYGLSEKAVKAIVKEATNSEVGAKTYLNNAQLAYEYGRTNQKDKLNDLAIDNTTKNLLYVVGQENTANSNKAMAILKQNNPHVSIESNVNIEKDLSMNVRSMEERARVNATLAVAEAYGSALNIGFHAYQTYRKGNGVYAIIDGKEERVSANGHFTRGNQIYFDVNAGDSFDSLGAYTIGHESGHYIAENNKEGFAILTDEVKKFIDTMAERDSGNYSTFEQDLADKEAMYKELRLKGKEGYKDWDDAQITIHAMEDVVCDAISTFAADPETFTEMMSNIEQRDKGLWETIKDTISKMITRLKNALNAFKRDGRFIDADQNSARAIQNLMEEEYNQLRSLYAKLMVQANENYNANQGNFTEGVISEIARELDGNEGEIVRGGLTFKSKNTGGGYMQYSVTDKNGVSGESYDSGDYNIGSIEKAYEVYVKTKQNIGEMDIDGNDSEHKYSIRSMAEGAGLYFGYNEKSGEFKILDKKGGKVVTSVTESQVAKSPLGNLITIARENNNINIIEENKQIKFLTDLVNLCLKYEDNFTAVWEVAGTQVFSAIKSNSDTQYGKTIDFSTVCKKTQQIINVVSETQKRLKRGLTKDEIKNIVYFETGKAGEPTPCPVCYVFSRWMGIGGILQQMYDFQQKYDGVDEAEIRSFMGSVEAEIVARANTPNRNGKLKADFFDKNGNVKFGTVIADLKSKATSKINAANKALATNADNKLKVQELNELMKSQTDKEANKTQTKINKLNAKIKDDSVLKEALKKAESVMSRYEEYQWLTKTYMNEVTDNEGNHLGWELDKNFKPVDPDILFDLNRGADFATKYPKSWKYRTTKGCNAGKAILPYSDARVGETIQGIAYSNVKDVLTGENNAFLNGDIEAQKAYVAKAIAKQMAQNLIGGMRYQSTSDWRFEYGSDYLMTFLEMQAIGANVQLYTKVIEAVDFLCTMGADVNMSVMPLDDGYVVREDGKRQLVFSSVTGINAEAAIKKSREYDNAQLILVGINDEHIKLALNGDDVNGDIVTFVIPFHGSGNTTKVIQELMNLLGENLDVTKAKDYSPVQSDHFKKNRTAEQKALWELRVKIISRTTTVNSKSVQWDGKLTNQEKALLNSESGKFLLDLYNRFYVDENAMEYGVALSKAQAEQIFPYEYWDKSLTYNQANLNGERFKEYCATMGIIPRFSGLDSDGKKVGYGDFSNEWGYWKTLIDRPMYRNDGTYRPQSKINATNFAIETLNPEWASQTYGDVMQKDTDPKKTNAIVENVINQLEKNDDGRLNSERVTDKETLDMLNKQLKNGEVTKVYRAMQVQPVDENGNVIKASVLRVVSYSPLMVEAKTFGKDGKTDVYEAKLFSPMAGMVNGKWSKNIELNAWEETTYDFEHATLRVDSNGKPKIDNNKKNASYGEPIYDYGLVKGGIDDSGKKLTDVPARYNPYIHTSLSALNDQFSSANKRPELVTVECIIPNSELTSGFRAEGAKDRVGAMQWHSGPTSSRLAKVGKARTVILTRYDMPIRVVPDSEVASKISEYIGDTKNIAIPESTITPSLAKELKQIGVSVLNDAEWEKYSDENPTNTFGKNKNSKVYSERTIAPTFYSKMSKVIDGIKTDKVGAGGVVSYLKGKGIKDEEIKWSGIEAFLDGKKSLTKADLQEFAKGSMLQIEEKSLGGETKYIDSEAAEGFEYTLDELKTLAKNYAEDNGYDGYDFEEFDGEMTIRYTEDNDIVDEQIFPISDGTRWSEYKTDGAENYREILFKMPSSEYSNSAMKTHWAESGVLAHARIDDQVTTDGRRMLFIEEIQSDWHNAGNKNGYQSKYKSNVKDKYYYKKVMEEILSSFQKEESIGKKIRDAGYNGAGIGMIFDYLIDYDTYKSTEATLKKKGVEFSVEEQDTIGEYMEKYAEAYAKWEKAPNLALLVPDAPFKTTYTDFVMKRLLRMAAEEGYDLIGWTTGEMQEERWSSEFAEGYRIEYGQDIPKFMRKYGKQWGATVSRSVLDESGENVYSMEITPEMKESVLYEGQPLFSERVQNNLLANKEDTALYVKNTKDADYIEMIFNGTKTEETRSKRTLDEFIGKKYMITDGKYVYGTVVFGNPHKYTSDTFHKAENQKKHRVPVGDKYDIKDGGIKWAYPILEYEKFDIPKKLANTSDYKYSFQGREAKFSERVLMGSMFSGGGTLEAGLVYQMVDKEFAVEYNKQIASVYMDNHGKEHMFVGDVTDFDSKKKDSVFYLHASPVCKNYSAASHKAGEQTLDIKTAEATARVLDEQMPSAFTVENVKRYIGSEAYNIITGKLDELGYKWDVDVYKASDYGNPTKRERMVIRAVKEGELPSKPDKVSKKTSWGDATRDLWDTELKQSYLVKSKIEAIRNTPGLKNLSLTKLDKPLMIYDTTKGKQVTYAWADELAPTLTTKCGDARIIMPDGKVYAPTPKFMGRLQGLPDNYKYPKAETTAFKIIGNGIPTQLTKAVMGGVIDSAYEQTHDGERLYSERDLSADPRMLLSSALETVAQNDIEKNYIKEYQDKIETINEQQKKLEEIRAELKELSFAKGKRDNAKIKALSAEATKISNRINIYDKQLLKLESTKALKDVVEREKAKARKLAEKKGRENLQNYRQRKNDTVVRNKIKNLIAEFNSRDFNPKQNKYIPQSLIQPVNDILSMINITSRSENMSAKLAELKVKYDALKNDPKHNVVYDPFISGMIQTLNEKVGNTPLNEMTTEQLDIVYNTLRALMTTVRYAVKLQSTTIQGIDGEMTAFQVSKAMQEETSQAKTSSEGLGAKWLTTSLRPETAFNRFAGFKKDSMWSKVYRMLDDGQLRESQIIMESNDIFKPIFENRKYIENISNPKKLVNYGLKDDNGNDISTTRGMMLMIRMALMNEDNTRHMMLGGLTVPDVKRYYSNSGSPYGIGHVVIHGISSKGLVEINDKIADAKQRLAEAKKNQDEDLVKEIKKEMEGLKEDQAELYDNGQKRMDDLAKSIDAIMTDEDRQFIQLAKVYFDQYSKKVLNETTLKMYGFEKAQVENYLPIHTDPNFRTASFENISRDVSLENAGFMKDRVNASNPILLEDLVDVINSQIKKVAKYAGLTLAVKDFQKIYGKSERGFANSLQDTIDTKFGGVGKEYIDNLLSDIVGARTSASTIFDLARGNMAGAVLSLNPRVALAQASSFPTAASELGYEPLMRALGMGLQSADRELIAKYSPLLYKRMDGGANIELADIKNLSKAQNKVMRKMNFLLGWIGMMDNATVGRLWYASEYYVDANTSLEKNTDEYYKVVAEVFNNVVERTQPNYSVMQRPDILRNPNALVKQLTMFMTQRLQNFNIVYDSAMKYNKYREDYITNKNGVTREDTIEARNDLVNAVTSQLVAGAMIVGIKFLVDALMHNMNGYRDDDDELTGSSITWSMLSNFLDSMMGNMLGGSELFSIVKSLITKDKYYGISLTGVSTYTDMIADFVSMAQNPSMKKAHSLAQSVCQLFGIPEANAEKIAKGIMYHVEDVANGRFFSFEAGVDRSNAQDVRRMYNAYTTGNTSKMRTVRDEFLNEYKNKGKTDKEAKTALRSAITTNLKSEYVSAYKSGNSSKMSQIRSFMSSLGIYDDVDKTIKNWIE